MRSALTILLRHRYPGLYGVDTSSGFEFEHADGWFAITDTLSGLLLEADPAARAFQVKEKLGTYRFYHEPHGPFAEGAVDVASELSSRTCEYTGMRGRLVNCSGWLTTVAADRPELLPDGVRQSVQAALARVAAQAKDDSRSPPPKLSEQDVLWEEHRHKARARMSAVRRDVPAGWNDLSDNLLRVVCHAVWFPARQPGPPQVESVFQDAEGGLALEATGLGDYERGALAMAQAMARRTHVVTGATGPVDDEGRPLRA